MQALNQPHSAPRVAQAPHAPIDCTRVRARWLTIGPTMNALNQPGSNRPHRAAAAFAAPSITTTTKKG